MKILFINATETGGGAAVSACRLHGGLEKLYATENHWIVGKSTAHRRHITATRQHESQTVEATKTFLELFLDKAFSKVGLQYVFFPFSSRMILKTAGSFNPDIISLHNTHGGYFKTALLPRLSRIAPIVWTLHDMWSFTGNAVHTFEAQSWRNMRSGRDEKTIYPSLGINNGRWLLKQKKKIYARAKIHLVSPSEWLFRLASESPVFHGKQMSQISHGVDLQLFRNRGKTGCRKALGIEENAQVLMFSTADDIMLSRWKGGQLLVDILDKLDTQTSSRLDILLLGKGEIQEDQRWNHLRIHQMGLVSSEALLPLLYSAADVLIHPARAENLPLTLIEAQACGVPCVTFDVGGCSEIVRDGVNGFLIEAFDTDRFVDKTLSILNEKETLSRFSSVSRRFAEESFSLQKMVAAYFALFESLLHRSP